MSSLEHLKGFEVPDWSAPLDVDEYRRVCTDAYRVKGMYLQAAVDAARREGAVLSSDHRYVAFKDYRCAQWLDVAIECATGAFPNVSLREAMRRLGLDAFPTFKASMVGKVILAATGGTVERTLAAGNRAYGVLLTRGTCEPTVEPGRALWQLRDVTTLADSFHVGAVEGILQAFGADGSVQVRRHSLLDVDLLASWSVAERSA